MKAPTHAALRATQSGVGWHGRSLLLAAIFAVAHQASAQTPDQPTAPKGNFSASGSGTSFSTLAPSGQQLTLTSDVSISVLLQAFSNGALIGVRPIQNGAGTQSANLLLSGLQPSTTYFFRQDGFPQSPLLSSPEGRIRFAQDISRAHGLSLSSLHESTYILANGTVSPSTAPIAVTGSTYTLTADLVGLLIVQRDSITIDGAGHTIFGQLVPAGAIDLSGRTGITIKSIVIQGTGSGAGIDMMATANCSVINSTITAYVGVSILSGGSRNVIQGNAFLNNVNMAMVDDYSDGDQFLDNTVISIGAYGLSLGQTAHALVRGNRFQTSFMTIPISMQTPVADMWTSGSSNTIIQNTFSCSGFCASLILDSAAQNNVVSSNTFNISSGATGLSFNVSSGAPGICGVQNTIRGNIFSFGSGGVGVDVRNCNPGAGNVLSANSFQGPANASPANIGIVLLNMFPLSSFLMTQNTFAGLDTAIQSSISNNFQISASSFSSTSLHFDNSANFQFVSNTVQNTSTIFTGSDVNSQISGDTFVGGNLSGQFVSGPMVISTCMFQNSGVALSYASLLTIANSNFSASPGTAVSVVGTPLATIYGSTFTSNGIALALINVTTVTVSTNNFQGNGVGISLRDDSGLKGTLIYHNNFIGNTIQAQVVQLTNTLDNAWNLPYPAGGNFWSDISGQDFFSGASQNTGTSDGIFDTPRVIAPNNADNYPFAAPSGWSLSNPIPLRPVANLAAIASTAASTSITLQWTAPSGTATSYVFRFSTSPFVASQFLQFTQIPNPPSPLPPGTVSSFAVTGLAPGTTYFFAMESQNGGLRSPVSNILQAVTSPDMPPNPVTDLAAQYDSLLQSSPTAISPANSDVLLTWSTPADDVGTTGFQVWRSTTAGQLGAFVATVTISGLDAGVTGFLGGKDYFFDAGSQFAHGTVLFYTAFPFDAAGKVNVSTANVQTPGITIDHIPPVVTAQLFPSTGSFVVDPVSAVWQTRRLPPAMEASFNLTSVTDDGASGGILRVALVISTQSIPLPASTTFYVVNSSNPFLLTADGGVSRTGCLHFVVTDKAGNSAQDAAGRCIVWDGLAPAASFIAIPRVATTAGQVVTIRVNVRESVLIPPVVTVRQSGLTTATPVSMVPNPSIPYSQFSGTYTVQGNYDGFAIITTSVTDIVGNTRVRSGSYLYVATGNPIYGASANPGDTISWNPARQPATISVSEAATVDLMLQISSRSANGSLSPILVSTFTNQTAGLTTQFQWDGTAAGVPQPDNPYVYTWTAYLPGGTFASTTGAALSGYVNMVRSASLSFTQRYPNSPVAITPTTSTGAAATALLSGSTIVGSMYDIQPSGLVFDPPAQLTICAPPGTTLPAGTTLDTYSAATNSWVPVTPYTQSGNCITASIAHLSLYALIAPAPKPVDVLPPRTQLIVGDPKSGHAPVIVSSHTPLSFFAVDDKLSIGDAQGAVARTSFGVDGSPFARFVSPFAIAAEGSHVIRYFSVDTAANTEQAHYSTVVVDATPPITALAVSTPSFNGFVSAATLFSLSAVDPVSNGVASGVAFTRYRVNGGAFAASPLAFHLSGSDGAYQVDYQSQDNVSNLEVLRSTAVFLDQTPPVTTPHTGAPSYIAADGTQYVTPAAPVAFTAVDPSSGAVASGVNRIEVALDGGAFSVYAAALTFAEGRHTILYRAVDNVGNAEATKTLSLQSDATPPVTAFKASGTYFMASAPEGARLYAPLAFGYSLPATDPVVNNAASGLAFTRYRTGPITNYASGTPTYAPSAFANYVSTFALSEGIRRVDFQSQDNVTNLELLKSATVFVDATPPATTLTVGAPQYAAGGTLYVSAVTPFTLSSQDPVVQEVASGVSGISFHLDANPFASYASTFTIPVPDGVHTASFYATDNVGNLETVKTSTVALDATPPITSLAILGGHQFPGPNAATFYASADTRFALPAVDPVVSGVASGLAFTRWQDNGGAFAAYVSTFALAEGAHALGYQSQDNVANVEVLRSTNAWIDATPPVTTVAIGSPTYTAADGTIYVTPATPIAFAAVDPNLPTGQPGSGPGPAGSGVARIEVSLDGAAFAPYTAALKLAEGRHAILYRAVDNVANVEAYHTLAVQSDATPPVSSLVIGQPQYQLPGILLVSSRTPFAVAAVDPVVNNVASGVKDSWYNVNDVAPSTGAFAQFLSSFTLSGVDVNKVIQFYSRDNVLNTEVVKSSTVLLDSTPPEISLLSPAACDSGICRVLKGKLPVLGTATDVHFASYRLDFAPGQNATTGYALVSSGTVAVNSGALGTWDASALAGWQTLRLTATDLVANVSVLTINVYVGDPATLMLLGNHETFDMPTGVAAGADGRIYVADRDNDRIAVFTSTGGLSAVFGGRHDDHQDDDKLSTTTLRLHEPAGVAVDAANNIYVADTDHQRVLKLSPAGQILLDLGRRKVERDDGGTKTEFASGKAPGEFRHPLGVAVDAAGSIYVADTGNSRVQIFTSTGGFALQFALPALPAIPEGDDHEAGEKDDDAPALGRPAGIAVDASGNIYLADLTGRRALRYDPSGRLTLTIPIPGDKPGQLGRPYGVAVSTSGNCLLVSDLQFAHILKFDMNGAQNLIFGARARGDDDHAPKPAGIALRKPAGLALDASSNLYVADRNAERVAKFGLPNGQATVVVPPPGPEDDDAARDVVSREDGGTVERKDKAAVAIPAQALSDDLKVSVSTPTADVAAAGARTAADANLKTASPPVDFGPEGTKFQAPVTLTLPYDPDLLAQQNGDESSLKVHYWNKDKGRWEDLDSQVDAQKRTVTAKTTHFSLYQVFATSASAVKPLAAADPTFTYHDGYAFPNPVRGASAVTLRVQPGLADSVEVHVYDLSGRKVHSSSNFTQSILDDGNGKGSQYTFDHVWDVSGVGSGVYMYVITARKAGMADIHKTGKAAVVK